MKSWTLPRRGDWTTTKTLQELRKATLLSGFTERLRLREELNCAEYFLRNYEKYGAELARRGITREQIEADIVRMRLELYGLAGMSELF